MTNDRKIHGIGVIGTSWAAKSPQPVASHPRTRVAAVCSARQARAEEAASRFGARNFAFAATVKEALVRQALGRIRHLGVTLFMGFKGFESMPWSWLSDLDHGGGALNALGSHYIDLIRYWCGDFESVSWKPGSTKPRAARTGPAIRRSGMVWRFSESSIACANRRARSPAKSRKRNARPPALAVSRLRAQARSRNRY